MPSQVSFEPINPEPAYRIAADKIRDKIVTGEIAVGAVLPSEQSMAEQLRINRSTVREAIRLLEESGIVARKPGGKKLCVVAPSHTGLSSRLTTAMVLNEITVEELWEVLMVLEPAAAAAGCRKASEEHIAALEKNLAQTAAHLDDAHSILELDLEFHELIAEASGNRALQMARQPIGELFYPAFDAVFQRLNAGKRLLVAHTTVVNAIKATDQETAGEWMRKHIVDFRRGCEIANVDITTPISRLGH